MNKNIPFFVYGILACALVPFLVVLVGKETHFVNSGGNTEFITTLVIMTVLIIIGQFIYQRINRKENNEKN